jgi:hypothetical protein
VSLDNIRKRLKKRKISYLVFHGFLQMEQIRKEKLQAETKALRKKTEFKARPYKNPFKK